MMGSCSLALSVSCTTEKAPPIAPFHHLGSIVSSTFKPLLKEWKQLPMKVEVSKSIKIASISLMDALIDSMFKFSEDPRIVQGNFAPVNEIGEAKVVSCIAGEVPKDFPQGVYIRTGPNPLFPEKISVVSIFGKSSLNWFQGDGMVHATYFDKDNEGAWRVSYKNRYVEAETFLMEKEKNKPLFLPAAEGQPRAVLASIFLNLLRFGIANKEYNNTSVFEHSGKVYTVAENHLPYEIDISNLDTLNAWDVDGAWDRAFTSHPKIVPGTKEMVIMGIDVKKPYYVLGIISADGKKMIHKVDLKLRCTLVHELAVTENYNVIMDYPLMMGLERLLAGKMLFEYERDQGARIGVMPRYGNAESIEWFDVRPHCSFHIINSFEDGDEIVVRGCQSNGSILPGPDHKDDKLEWYRRAFQYASGDSEGFDPSIDGIIFSRPYEWRMNMKTREVKEGYLVGTEFAMDFPAINNSFMGLKSKYAYAQVVDSVTSANTGMSIYKMFAKLCFDDREKGEGFIKVEYHVLEDGHFCSGIQFAAKPGGIIEDDGWVICYVQDEKTNISYVYIIDAKKFTAGPVAKIALPQRVPYGFHGAFINKIALSKSK